MPCRGARHNSTLDRMTRHPKIGGFSVAVGVIGLGLTLLGAVWYGLPIMYWASLLNIALQCALIAAGFLLWTGHRLSYLGGVVTWGMVVAISMLNIASFLWSSIRGAAVPWHLYVGSIVYTAVGYEVIRVLVLERRAARAQPPGVNHHNAV